MGDSVVAKPRLEPFTTLAYGAAIARRARFGTGVLLPALRQRAVLGPMGLGPPQAVVDVLKRYQTAGATDLCIRFAGDDQLAQLERFVRDVLPAFQE